VSPICCSRTEREKACPDTAALQLRGDRECLGDGGDSAVRGREYRRGTRRRTGS
jgi:hypothetical protein